jgi:hypothetical protein
MSITVHRPLKIIAFNANGTGTQDHEVRRQLQYCKIDIVLFSEAHLKPHMRFYIPNYEFYRTDHEDRHKDRTAIAVKKGIPHICVNLPPPLSAEVTGICIPIGNTEMLLAAVYKPL